MTFARLVQSFHKLNHTRYFGYSAVSLYCLSNTSKYIPDIYGRGAFSVCSELSDLKTKRVILCE